MDEMTAHNTGKIYELICNKTHVKYLGITYKPLDRAINDYVAQHKLFVNQNEHDDLYKWLKVYDVLENEDYTINLLEEFPCAHKRDLLARSFELQSQGNYINAYRRGVLSKYKDIKEYREQYYIDNKDCINEYSRGYYENNMEKEKKRKNEKIQCGCGCSVTYSNLAKHKKTNKHHKLMAKLDPAHFI
jgi:hypothetical protein